MGLVRRTVTGFCLAMVTLVPALSQELNFGNMEKLPTTVNSGAEESMPLLAPDGKTLYFTRLMYDQNVGGKFAGQDIWVSRFDGRRWTKAENRGAAFKNNKKNNAVIGVARDGNTLYLLETSSSQKLKGIHFSRNMNGVWTDPELIPIEGISPEGFVGFYVSPDFDVILISMKGPDSRGEEDLYVSVKDGTGRWGKPKNLGPSINTTGFEISPYLSDDKNRLFFSSNGHRGYGDADVFYCDRLYNSWELWSEPKNLGEKVNSKAFDAAFSMKGDSVAFLASSRDGRSADLFRIEIVKGYTDVVQESIDKLINEANALLTDIKGTGDKATIIFEEQSSALTDVAKTDLTQLADKTRKTKSLFDFEILAYAASEKEQTDQNGLVQKRVEEVRRFLVSAGIGGVIRATVKPSTSKLESPRYVSIIAKERR